MFVYLFSLCEDKTSALSGTPAGVLYMHSSRSVFSFDSKSLANTNISSEENSSYKMKGVVLGDDEDVVRAMEKSLSGKYIPVYAKKNGDLSGNIASLGELGLIHKKINQLISKMGNDLHFGCISQSPVKNKSHKDTCDKCDYQDVCANRRYIKARVLDDLSDAQVKQELSKEFEEDNNATVD
jgi:ATP-dependent helicase/DNAse subunit B